VLHNKVCGLLQNVCKEGLQEMSGHGPITEWSDYSIKDLKKALNYLHKLDALGFQQDEDLLFSIADEIEMRSRKKEGRF
jgi:hypothetical protein